MATPNITTHTGKDGTTTYRFRLSHTDPHTGQRRQPHFTYSSRKAAERGWVVEQARIAASGHDAPPRDLLMRELLTEWLATKTDTAPNTYDQYEYIVRVHLIPQLGHHRAARLQPSHVTALHRAMAAAGLSPQTVHICHTRLRQALQYALDDQLVTRNVAEVAGAPKAPHTERPVWTAEQARAFLDTAASHGRYGPVWAILVGAGVRRGEVLGLRWADVDWAARTLCVVQGVTTPKGGAKVGPLKTPGSARRVRVDQSIIAALREHQAAQREHARILGPAWDGSHDLIFPRASGAPLNPNQLYPEYNRLCALCGVPRTHLHDQRHTHATLALQAGASIPAISKRLGHSKISTTLNTYSHVTQSMEDSAEEAISGVLFGLAAVPSPEEKTGS